MGHAPIQRDRARPRVFPLAQMLRIGSTYHRPRARPHRRGVQSLALAAGASLALAAGPVDAATLIIKGAGEGHGVGMSQDGAYGFARHGFAYRAILAHYYTATTIGHAPANAVVRVLVGEQVQRIPLERYVRGVIAAEMPSSWPLAALEAQAVASRSYALTAHAGGSRFDVYSDTRSQVYRGAAAETLASNEAAAKTAGEIVLYHGRPATTYFFASSGGMTENIENAFPGSEPQPWLRGVADPYNSGRAYSWTLSMSFAAAAARLQGLLRGSFRGIEVLRRGVSPRILTAEILGSAGTTQLSGPELAERMGLSATWAYFFVKNGTVTRAEPDRSRHTPAPMTPTTPPHAPTVLPTGRQGGTQAPSALAASPPGAAGTGGTASG